MDAHRNSASQWIDIYQQGDYAAIVQVSYGTNKSELEAHTASITELFTTNPPRSLNEAVLKVKELTTIQRSPSCLRSFIKRRTLQKTVCISKAYHQIKKQKL